jgi:hypothetical protein
MVSLTPERILESVYEQASQNLQNTVIEDKDIQERVGYVCQCMNNRAGVRLLMSCLLAKLHNPNCDPRKPYTEIGSKDCFSGRSYDEQYLTPFINAHRLPCNATTAFLTPTLRNINRPLTTSRELVGRPRALYQKTLQLLEDVAKAQIGAEVLMIETVRILLLMRNEKLARIESLRSSLSRSEGALPLSAETIVNLIQQHLSCKNSSRLPVLIVAAAYEAAGQRLAECLLPLQPHNAADFQTGSIGDLEICLTADDAVVTAYEMKMKRITREDIDIALTKIAKAKSRIHNYLFITTDTIDPVVTEYAAGFYAETGGTEIAILDCIGFLRHFLHLFHRIRADYLNAYQRLVLNEPDSAVSQTLKEAFLALRQSAESDE